MNRRISDFESKSNNLNLLKFLASLLVIYSHAHTLVTGERDFLLKYSHDTITLGGLAVVIFFFASGYYVTKSLIAKESLIIYFKGRFARIYPLFFAVIVITVFIMGPCVTTLSVGEYYTSGTTWKHLSYLLMIPNYTLPGVFENNPMTAVNGSLWTLVLETLCYILLAVMYKLKLMSKDRMKYILILFAIVVAVLFGVNPSFVRTYEAYIRPAFVFAMGVVYYIYKDSIKLDYKYLLICIIMGVPCFLLDRVSLFFVVFFPYILSSLVFAKKQIPEKVGNLGKYSYAIYLIAFPIQQVLINYNHQISVLENALFSCLLSVVLGIILYYFIEKPAGALFQK